MAVGPFARILAQIVVPVVAVLARAIPAAYGQALNNARKAGVDATEAAAPVFGKRISRSEALMVLNITEQELKADPQIVQKVSEPKSNWWSQIFPFQGMIEWIGQIFANDYRKIMNASFSFHKSKYSHRTYRFSLLSNFRRIFQSVQLQYSNSSDTLKPTMSASREAFTCNPKSTEPTNCSWNSRPKSTSKTSMEANKKAKHARNAMVDCRLEYAAS